MVQCVAASNVSTGHICGTEVVHGKTWCANHIESGVRAYRKYKKLEEILTKRLGEPLMHKVHLGRICSLDLNSWSKSSTDAIYDLQRLRSRLTEVIRLRAECSKLFYTASVKLKDDAYKAHQYAIECRNISISVIDAHISDHISYMSNQKGVIVVGTRRSKHNYSDSEDGDEDDSDNGEDDKEDCKNDTIVEDAKAAITTIVCVSRNRNLDTDRDLDAVMLEMRREYEAKEGICPCGNCTRKSLFDGPLTVRRSKLMAEVTDTMHFPNENQWTNWMEDEECRGHDTGLAYPVTVDVDVKNTTVSQVVEIYPFNVFNVKTTHHSSDKNMKEDVTTIYLPDKVRRMCSEMAAVARVAYLRQMDEEQDEDDHSCNHVPFAGVDIDSCIEEMIDSWHNSESSEGDYIELPEEWFLRLFKVIQPWIDKVVNNNQQLPGLTVHTRDGMLTALMRTFFKRVVILMIHGGEYCHDHDDDGDGCDCCDDDEDDDEDYEDAEENGDAKKDDDTDKTVSKKDEAARVLESSQQANNEYKRALAYDNKQEEMIKFYDCKCNKCDRCYIA